MDVYKSLALMILLLIPAVHAQSTILTAKQAQGHIEIDGFALEEDWKQAAELVVTVQDGSIGKATISLKTLYDKDNIYFFAAWDDPTESVEKHMWQYNGTAWIADGHEDGIAFAWNIADSINGFNIAGCAMLCHGDRMHTNSPNEIGDIWYWKAGTTNPLGYMDDKWIDNTIKGEYTEEAKEAAIHPDGTFAQFEHEQTNIVNNINSKGTGPRYYEPNPENELDAKFILSSEVESREAVEIPESTNLIKGLKVPGYIIKRPEGNRGDIESKGRWRDGRWNLEFKRKLETGFENDVKFDVGRTYRFGVAAMDNAGGFEAYGKGHSFDLGARTLEFGGIGSEEVTRLSLIKDYITVAEAHTAKNELAEALSNIGDALIIFNELGSEMAGIDPELYLYTKNLFMDLNRGPTLNGLSLLQDNIDLAVLTFQGKRTPAEPEFRIRILVLWGKIQLYALILLALVSLAPIFKAVQLGRKPTFRRLSVFILVIVIPLLFEGIGRIGILFKITPLQNFSFLTNELATLQWAILMFFGLFIAKSGFDEVEASLNTLEFYSAKLEDDIEQMKKLESELRESEQRYRSIFEASPIGIIEIEPDGKILNCNQAASEILDFPGGAACKNKMLLDYIKEPEKKRELSLFLKKGEEFKDKHVTFKFADKKDHIISMSAESITGEQGTPVRIEIALMDITDRINAEEERLELEKKLVQSERLASIGKLAMGFAHEISNPLTNIQLAAEILYKKVGKELKARVEVITKNVDLASSVVRNLLEFSRNSQLNIIPLDLEAVLDESINVVSPRMKKVKLVKNVGALPMALGDPKQIEQVFSNIIINSVQAMPDGGRILVEADFDESFVIISFTDTGGGISKELLGKIFDPFFTTKEVGAGTGLGLSLSYGIVKAHGGDITVESELSKGTTVRVKLPLAKTKRKNRNI